jgi:biopolymer transport protein ExbB
VVQRSHQIRHFLNFSLDQEPSMDSPSGLFNVWSQGDAIIRGVAVILLTMSLLTWTVLVAKWMQIARLQRQATRSETFWSAPDLTAGLTALGDPQGQHLPANPFHQLAARSHQAAAHLDMQVLASASISASASASASTPIHAVDRSDWVTRHLRLAIDDASAQLQAGLAVLASVGSTAPFIGLFGTVWGIYHALMGIGQAGQATMDQVAGPVGEALVMTALGLAVAIPAVLGYNLLIRRNKVALSLLHRFAHDLHAHLITGARIAPAGLRLPAAPAVR